MTINLMTPEEAATYVSHPYKTYTPRAVRNWCWVGIKRYGRVVKLKHRTYQEFVNGKLRRYLLIAKADLDEFIDELIARLKELEKEDRSHE